MVYAFKPNSIERKATSKLDYRWEGSYKIIEIHGPVTFSLSNKEGKRLLGTFHAEKLYMYSKRGNESTDDETLDD